MLRSLHFAPETQENKLKIIVDFDTALKVLGVLVLQDRKSRVP